MHFNISCARPSTFFIPLHFIIGQFIKLFKNMWIQSMIWALTLQIWKHGYSDDFNFIILFFIGILLLYAIEIDIHRWAIRACRRKGSTSRHHIEFADFETCPRCHCNHYRDLGICRRLMWRYEILKI
jgi:hypothetical protein